MAAELTARFKEPYLGRLLVKPPLKTREGRRWYQSAGSNCKTYRILQSMRTEKSFVLVACASNENRDAKHHRVRCAGRSRMGERCTVTSSSEHEHAAPLREGMAFCAHHASQADGCDDEHFELYECDVCGDLCAVRIGQPPVCQCSEASERAVQASESGAEDAECEICGQLKAWCACGHEFQPVIDQGSDDYDDGSFYVESWDAGVRYDRPKHVSMYADSDGDPYEY